MLKTAFFPYHPDMELLVERRRELQEVEPVGLISYKEDSSPTAHINRKLGILPSEYEKIVDDADSIILLDNYRGCFSEKYFEVIDEYNAAGKNVFLTPKTEYELYPKCRNYIYTKLVREPKVNEADFKTIENFKAKKYDIEIPVIAVIGQGKHCGKFETTLAMKKQLEDKGYKTACFASNALGALFGCYTLPPFLYNDGYSFEEKVIKLNNYFFKVIMTEKPDVLLVSMPEGVMSFSKDEYNHFCEYSLILSNALPVDFAVLCMYFTAEININGVQRMYEYCLNKYNAPVRAISISKTIFDPAEGMQGVSYSYLDDDIAKNLYPKSYDVDFPIINLLDQEDAMRKMDYLIGLLETNLDTI